MGEPKTVTITEEDLDALKSLLSKSEECVSTSHYEPDIEQCHVDALRRLIDQLGR